MFEGEPNLGRRGLLGFVNRQFDEARINAEKQASADRIDDRISGGNAARAWPAKLAQAALGQRGIGLTPTEVITPLRNEDLTTIHREQQRDRKKSIFNRGKDYLKKIGDAVSRTS
jgi:hypothetical protein